MTDFVPMRAGLVARGLLDSRHALTAAGHAHARALIDDLANAPPPPRAAPIRWNTPKKGPR